jgi:phosphate starvation-inducible PhoH-like protein
MLDELYKYLTKYQINKLIQEDIIEIVPLEYMRGRNMHGSFMILDEAQNATLDQIKMFITRLGRDSKCVINGDLEQSDLEETMIGLRQCITKLDGIDVVAINQLTYEDIIRNSVLAKVLQRLS